MTLLDEPTAVSLASALGPVRDALLTDARSEAARIVETARAEADTIVALARSDADEAVQQARRRAEATSAAHTEREMAQARRAAHATVLQARDELWRELNRRLGSAAERMREDARYPLLLDRLEGLARSQLGDGAVIERDPQLGGGIVAVDGPRQVDYRLPALAERVLETLAEEVAGLWS